MLGWRRTHKDPFESEWEQIFSWLQANPERSSGDIFRDLQRRSPGRYHPLQIRILQRGMRNIRAYLMETWEEQWPGGSDPGTIILASFCKMPRQDILAAID